VFAPVAPTTLEQVDAAYRPAHGKWVGIAARSTVFVYNPSKLKESDLPKSLLDLASPSWKGRWAASPAGADFQAIVAAMLEQKGEAATLDWLKAMKTNASAYRGNSAVLKAVNAGQIDSGVIYHYYSFVDQSKTGENSKNTAALLQTPGPGCVCQHLRRRAGFQQAQGTSPGLPEVDHRQGRPGGAQGRQFVRIRRRQERPIQPQAGATAAIGRPKVDASKLNSKKPSS
jgi:iron(III) transport system substrate-binding protein